MAGFHISGRIEETASHRFTAVVTAVPSEPGRAPKILHEEREAESWLQAAAELREMAVAMGARIRAEGHEVLNVEIEQ